MQIINSTSVLNLVNLGYVYLCQADDGSYWFRSTAGNWVQIESSVPVDTETLNQDFQEFLKKGVLISESDAKLDNTSQVVVDPVKIEPVIEPSIEETPIEEPPIESVDIPV